MSETVQTIAMVAGVIAFTAGLYWLCKRFMRPFQNRAFICLFAVLVGGWVVYSATTRFVRGQGGFKLGVDLAGGTILVYEIDEDKLSGSTLKREELKDKMVEMLKRRIDPNDLYNVTIRPIGDGLRYEIILPTGGSHQAAIKREAWDELLKAVQENPDWKAALAGRTLDIEPDLDRDLVSTVRTAIDVKKLGDAARAAYPDKLKDVDLTPSKFNSVADLNKAITAAGVSADELKKVTDGLKPTPDKDIVEFVASHYRFAGDRSRQDFSAENVENIKSLIARQGSLEFRIAANQTDDSEAIRKAKEFVANNKERLDALAEKGQPPPPIERADLKDPTSPSYSWVELGKTERRTLNLTNQPQPPRKEGQEAPSRRLYADLAEKRGDPKANGFYEYRDVAGDKKKNRSGSHTLVFYSRECKDRNLPMEERSRKAVEYFMLLRDPLRDEKDQPKTVSGKYLRSADVNDYEQSVSFNFDAVGARLFAELTTANKPSLGPNNEPDVNLVFRDLVIMLDGQVMSAPSLNEPITGGSGQITMEGSPRSDRAMLVKILRSGALPATLKSTPVNESTIGPTLGGDTISKGLWSVGLAFAAVMIFMMWYYEFAGVVACSALLVNLLLTVAFMVFVNATFTLPGLAGLVLMLGMAVDANVLIYERIREEKDRGAGLSLALRNGYDRAFPTIIDTHLTSFFTAIVLYAVGNDQLRGFGISLASGLVISLFTSLYMTRLIFDVWQYKGWLKKLDMHRFFTKTSINFMRIRNYMFAATTAMTVFGLAVFLIRGQASLNVDFVGGTSFGGKLKEGLTSAELRSHILHQTEPLAVDAVRQIDDEGRLFEIDYKNNRPPKAPTVGFADPVIGKDATKAAREADVAARAAVLPEPSVEQIFVSSDKNERSGASRYFRVRTTEKADDLVKLSVDRLLSEVNAKSGQRESLLQSPKITGYKLSDDKRKVTLSFDEPASRGYLERFLERSFRPWLGEQAFTLTGEGAGKLGKYKEMLVEIKSSQFDALQANNPNRLEQILEDVRVNFNTRPQPEQLEVFDAQLAATTRNQAFYAILASWAVILLFLWFRFGNWTFGVAAIFCLIHDLAFTLGCIAGCHYLVHYTPALASFLFIEDFKIDLGTVAALLTLVGYSVNDTIVVFDRIREVRGKNPQLTPQMINDAINQALSRTLLASATVFIVVGVLFFFGGESIRLFAFVMVVGVLVGTYSSIYVASPLLLMFGEGKDKRQVGGKTPALVQA